MLSLRAPVRTAPLDERRRARLPELRIGTRHAPDLDVRGLDVERELPQLRSVGRRVCLRWQLHVWRTLNTLIGGTTMDPYRPLFEALMTFEPPVYLFGGFAEDALLHGAAVRPHEDVDVLVARHSLERQLENARAIGFAFDEVRFAPIEGAPLVIGTTDGSIDLEISVYDMTDEGSVCFVMVDERELLVRVELSDGVFDHPLSQLDGVAVRTVSPLAQIQIREGIRLAGGFGPPRPKDIPVQQELLARFFPGQSVESLHPTLTYLEQA